MVDDTRITLEEPSITALARQVIACLDEEAPERAASLMQTLHPADQAHILDLMPPEKRQILVQAIAPQFNAQVLAYIEGDLAAEILNDLGVEISAKAVAALQADQAIWLLEDLNDRDKQEILAAVPLAIRQKVRQGLSYPESSAGRLMRTRIIRVPAQWTVKATLDYLFRHDDLPDHFDTLFVVDRDHRLLGCVALSRLVRSTGQTRLRSLMDSQIRRIPVGMDQEELALMFRKYGLTLAPVVEDDGLLVGIVLAQDMLDVMEEEAREDLLRLGGVSGPDFYSDISQTIRRRFPWLFVNLLTAILASIVIGVFEATITRAVALAVLMPIIASMGGNAGVQTMTVAVRALATQELNAVNAWRAIGKESLVGMVNGLLFASVAIAMVLIWYQDVELATVFAAATIITLTAANVAGILIPLTLNHYRIDPAVSSTVFLTTVTDVVGFFSFLGLASVIFM